MADSLTVLVSLSIRGSLILLAAFMFAPLFKDAARRHFVWLCGLSGFVLLPIATTIFPV
jgi:hypothetical protein